ncbi:MAG: hypothetical protein IPK82_17200 [Polyangiaceae bacterium]|nr:hypothetical protein [Polyangiaceae bacterium]
MVMVDEVRTTAGEALILYQVRKQTLITAGVDFKGVDALLAFLQSCPSDDPLRPACFIGPRQAFVVFINQGGRAIGCIQVEKGIG